MESMEAELKSLTQVWITVLLCLTYCYLISRDIPKGMFRLISVLPIIPIFIILPLSLTSIHLLGILGFFIAWLANFKLLLFSFNQGPLSSPSISFLHFISIACFPINFRQNISPKTEKSISQNPGSSSPLSFLVYAIKGLVIVLLIYVYKFKQYLHPNFIIFLYCVHIYFLLELILIVTAKSVQFLLGLELEPQFNNPFVSTSLQDFWGKRWNLVVTGILRPTVYQPVQFICARIFGKRCAQLIALLATFVVSGLMHELIFYYFGRVWPTWEVFSFFVLHGACLAVEIELKRCFKNRFQLPPLVSGPLTVVFVLVTGSWLFFPQYLRCGADVKSLGEYAIVAESVKGLIQKWWGSFL
ncbi:acyl-CoA--sterol O-acyltransferase 1-like [Papaver somniferum]|nr:acyl-CoA--sterol O-acyltransferase 1-like [Papaver somniferum]